MLIHISSRSPTVVACHLYSGFGDGNVDRSIRSVVPFFICVAIELSHLARDLLLLSSYYQFNRDYTARTQELGRTPQV